MSDEEHSDSEFNYTEEQQTAERNASRCGWHFDKVEAIGEKLVSVVLIFAINKFL